MKIARAEQGVSAGAIIPRGNGDISLDILGLGVGLTLLVAAGMMFTGHLLPAWGIVSSAFLLFVVAFAAAAWLRRLRMISSIRAALLGAMLGWALSAPLGSLITTAVTAAAHLKEPFQLAPEIWLGALIPLAAVCVAAGIHRHALPRHDPAQSASSRT